MWGGKECELQFSRNRETKMHKRRKKSGGRKRPSKEEYFALFDMGVVNPAKDSNDEKAEIRQTKKNHRIAILQEQLDLEKDYW